MKQKAFLSLLIVLIIFGFLACLIDKTPISLEIEDDCWNRHNTIRDYEFIKNRYFFVDTFYTNYYEQGFTDDLSNWIYIPEKVINKLEIFISTLPTNPDQTKSVAAINPQNYYGLNTNDYDTVTIKSGKVEKGHFFRLIQDLDYDYCYARGFFWVNVQVPSNKILAISYKTDEKQVGTFVTDIASDTTKLPVFRLIKSPNMKPEYEEIWPLTMRNVYSLGDTAIQRDCFNIQIEYNPNGEHQTIQQFEPKKSYMYLLGLDRKDKNGELTEYGDGMIDDNILLVNRRDGILIFPGRQPFDPLLSSRFQIADTTKAHLYNTTDQHVLSYNTKFVLCVTSKIDK